MIPFERRNLMLAELAKNKVVSLAQFCHALGGVSESTVRRDLLSLEKEGLIETLRGGAARLIDGSLILPVFPRNFYTQRKRTYRARPLRQTCHDGELISRLRFYYHQMVNTSEKTDFDRNDGCLIVQEMPDGFELYARWR